MRPLDLFVYNMIMLYQSANKKVVNVPSIYESTFMNSCYANNNITAKLTSGIPGAPFGPWYRKITTVPGLISPAASDG